MTHQVVRCEDLPEGFELLRDVAKGEGFDFLDRLADRWRDGRYLTDAASSLFAVFVDAGAVAVGAQAEDEYAPGQNIRRMRHFYVHPDLRRSGVGRSLAGALILQGFEHAPLLTVNATHAVSRTFWESLGFAPVDHPFRSHELRRDA